MLNVFTHFISCFKKTQRLTACFIFLVISGCSSQPTKDISQTPGWILNPNQTYPVSNYFTGVGSATTLDLAKDRARSDLAKVFQVAINEVLVDKQKATINFSANQQYSEESNSLQRELIASTEQTLSGITIMESWQNPTTQEYFALASLNRMQLYQQLSDKISELDQASALLLKPSHSNAPKLTTLRSLDKAIKLQTKRFGYQQQLQVIDASGIGVAPKWPLEELKTLRLKLADQIIFSISTKGAYESELANSLKSALKKDGYRVEFSGGYQLLGQLSMDTLNPRGGWYWARGTLTIDVQDTDSKALMNSQTWRFKVSATDQSLLNSRLMQEADKILHSQLNDKLINQ
ncbi:MAG: LPP20 family lipoprotein [Pseudomonadota bacterium]